MLQTSGPISFADLRTEFNGNDPVRLGDYYRGNGRVPNELTQIPVVGNPISLSQFYGAQNEIEPTIPVGGYLVNQSYSGTRGPGTFVNEVVTVPALWRSTLWRYEHYFVSAPQYNYAYMNFACYKNGGGAFTYSWATPKSPSYPELGASWFRDQSSARTGNSASISLRGGDTFQHVASAGTRDHSAKPFTFYTRLVRIA